MCTTDNLRAIKYILFEQKNIEYHKSYLSSAQAL